MRLYNSIAVCVCTEILLLYETVTLFNRKIVIFGQYCSVNLCQIKLHVFRSTEIIAIMVNACYFQWTIYSAVWRDWFTEAGLLIHEAHRMSSMMQN